MFSFKSGMTKKSSTSSVREKTMVAAVEEQAVTEVTCSHQSAAVCSFNTFTSDPHAVWQCLSFWGLLRLDAYGILTLTFYSFHLGTYHPVCQTNGLQLKVYRPHYLQPQTFDYGASKIRWIPAKHGCGFMWAHYNRCETKHCALCRCWKVACWRRSSEAD